MRDRSVLAVVMTYNRKEQLRRCLFGISAQTLPPAGVLVLDNGCTDGTLEMLAAEFPEARVHSTGENLGCAGAMRVALHVVLESTPSPDYIWFFDDDVVPYSSCLETLLRELRNFEQDDRVGVLRPMVRDPRTQIVGGGGLSHAALLSSAMVREVGLPPAEIFIELSDRVYNTMIRRRGYSSLRIPYVLAEHPVRDVKSMGQVLREGFRVHPWRLYYAVRNRVWFSLHFERSLQGFVHTVAISARTFFLLTMFGRPRRGQMMVIRGFLDGLLGRLGRRVEPNY